jgi:cell fate regulator YaaT (PSP1 superfamily)
MSERQTVVAVKLRYNPKIFWFDPALSTYETGDHVLVDTERGREIGLVVDAAVEVTEKQIKDLKSPLKPVIRALSEADFDRIDELDAKGHEAMPVFRELIEKHGLEMKPVSVEFLFSGDKAVFYFSNDERVDFRDLVRDLASHFHTRVDMRQIGVRDEARILGGLAHCGEELCCARLGGEFQPVSIRMAKEQDLPLNPAKISGACGRLMCCLRYEFEAYKDFKNRAPRRGALIETPIGQAKVIDFDTPREIITMRLEDGKQLSIPLSEFDCHADENGKQRPCCVSRDAIDRCASSSILMALAALEQELTQSAAPDQSERSTRRPRRASRQGAENGGRQRRSEGQARGSDGAAAKESGDRSDSASRGKDASKGRPRPGQHSSGLRGTQRGDGRGGSASDGNRGGGGSDGRDSRVSDGNRGDGRDNDGSRGGRGERKPRRSSANRNSRRGGGDAGRSTGSPVDRSPGGGSGGGSGTTGSPSGRNASGDTTTGANRPGRQQTNQDTRRPREQTDNASGATSGDGRRRRRRRPDSPGPS